MVQTKDPQAKETRSPRHRSTAGQRWTPSDPPPPTTRKETVRGAVSPEERHRLIAEAAYFRALARGFNGGDSLMDWLAAEQEIDQVLATSRSSERERAT